MNGGFLNNYFGFNRQQRNGLFVLLVLSLILLIVRIGYPFFIEPANISISDLPLIERKTDSAYAAAQKPFYKKREESVSKTLFVFDPNTVSHEQLLSLGFREKTAATFLKFRSKGVVFKNKKDLRKIYGISEKFYAALEPYILIADKPAQPVKQERNATEQAEVKEKIAFKPPVQKTVELNSADSAALTGLNGIGPSYVRRILKYRMLLGGYTSIDQLKEVYGLPEELFEKIKALITVGNVTLKKINLNTGDFKTLNRHPYLSYELTKRLFDWRRKTSITATNLKDILEDEALYRKLLPYVAFD